MTFRQFIVLVAGAFVVALGAARFATGASAPPSLESWADTTHGWRLIGRQSQFGAWPAMQATDNGGRTWRTVRRQPSWGITEIQRTTATDGVIFIRRPRKPVLAPTSSGRRWTAIPIVPRGFPVEASGRDLFWVNEQEPNSHRQLYRMRNALLGETRTAVVAALPEGRRFEALRAVPGGVAAIANKFASNSQFSLVVYRNGTAQTFSIAHATKPLICPDTVHTFAIEWPVITIVVDKAFSNPGPLGACMSGSGTVAFISPDGGTTWTESTVN
jgi:hypothetical protein